MNEDKEVNVYCPSNYNFVKKANKLCIRLLEIAVVVVPIMYFLWTINFTMTIKILGTVLIGIPLTIILLIGHRGKSIGQIIILSICFSYSKIKLHLRSVNDESTVTGKDISSITKKLSDKTKNFSSKYIK